MKNIFAVFCFLLVFPLSAFAQTSIKIGTMPAADSILLYAAKEEGIFEKNGLDVEIVPFQSAIELGAAMRSGSVDGYLTCIVNAAIQHTSGTPQTIIATTSYARPTQRHFGLAVSPKKQIVSLEGLKGKTVAVGKDTIVDFLLTQFLESRNINDSSEENAYVKRQDIRSIAMRLQLLMAGQLDTALLPEPLVTVLESRGAYVLMDDTSLRMPLAVISYSSQRLTKDIYERLRKSLDECADRINADPNKYKQCMVKNRLLSADVSEKYTMLTFEKSHTPCYLPTEQELDVYLTWLYDNNLIKVKPDPKDLLPDF